MKYSIANKLDQIRRTVESIVSPTKVRRSSLPDDEESVKHQPEMRNALQELRDLVLAMPLRAPSSVDTAIAGYLIELNEISTDPGMRPLLIEMPSNYAVQPQDCSFSIIGKL